MTCILLVTPANADHHPWQGVLASPDWTVFRCDPPPLGCRYWAPAQLSEAPDLIVMADLSPLEQQVVTLRQWHRSRRRRFPPVVSLAPQIDAEPSSRVEGVNLALPHTTSQADLHCVARLLTGGPLGPRSPLQPEWIARIWATQQAHLRDYGRSAAAVQGTRTVLERLLAARLDETALAAALALTLLPDGARPLAHWAHEFAPKPAESEWAASLPLPPDRLRARLIRVGPQRFALPLDEEDRPLPGWPAPAAGVLDRAEGVAFVPWSPLMGRLSGFIGTALCRDGLHWLIPQPAVWPPTALQADALRGRRSQAT